MPNSLYLINPCAKGGSYFGAEVFARYGFPHSQGIADLAAVTVAALAPSGWSVSVCDEHISSIDFDHEAEFIGITGKITQAARMLEVAAEFHRRGKTVLMGGPCASLSPELFRGHCDILVTGELETIAAEFFADVSPTSGCSRLSVVSARLTHIHHHDPVWRARHTGSSRRAIGSTLLVPP